MDEDEDEYYLSEDTDTQLGRDDDTDERKVSGFAASIKEKLAPLVAQGTTLGALWEKISKYWLFLLIGGIFIIFSLVKVGGIFSAKAPSTTIKPVTVTSDTITKKQAPAKTKAITPTVITAQTRLKPKKFEKLLEQGI